MKTDDAEPHYETSEIGTPLDYTSDVYRIYFEVNDRDGMALKVLSGFLGDERGNNIFRLAHGYEIEAPIQCVPDLVRLLSKENIAVYQVVRYAKTGKLWR